MAKHDKPGQATIIGDASKNPRAFKMSRRVLVIIAVLICFAAIAGGGFYSYDHYYKKSNTSSQANCTVNFTNQCALDEAAKILNPPKPNELAALVTKIQGISGYQSDPNLLYVTVNYYISVGDSKNATKYYDMLVKVYDPKVGFSEKLGNDTLSMTQLESTVSFLKRQSDPAHLNYQSGGGATK